MRRRPDFLLLILLLSVPCIVCAQQVYKWTDAHGIVHYSDSPPAHGTKYKSVHIAADTASSVHTPTVADGIAEDDTASASSALPSRIADTPANRKKVCGNISANLTLLRENKPLIVKGKNGKNELMSKARRAQELSTAQKQYQTYCGN
ncbi:MAG TPA: DUF4124 domain-containing protein [Rhodanobacteraceae bacterium]